MNLKHNLIANIFGLSVNLLRVLVFNSRLMFSQICSNWSNPPEEAKGNKLNPPDERINDSKVPYEHFQN